MTFDPAAHADAVRVALTDTATLHLALPVTCACSIRELSQARIQQQYGKDDVRMADLLVLQVDLAGADPGRGLKVTISSGPQAGDWYVLDPLGRDALALTLRLRRTDRHSSATPGATTTR